MSKKVYINVFESPYVNMDSEDKLYKRIEPTPKKVFCLEKNSDKGLIETTNFIVNLVAEYSTHDIVESYESQKYMHIDVYIPLEKDCEIIKSIINNASFFCSSDVETTNHYIKGLLKLSDYIGCINEDEIDNENIISCNYSFSNTGAAGLSFSLAVLINSSFVVVFCFFARLLFQRFFRYETKGKDGNKYLRYYNERKVLKQLRKLTNKSIKSYEFLGHRIRKKKVGLYIVMKNKKHTYHIKTNPFSGIESYKEVNSDGQVE